MRELSRRLGVLSDAASQPLDTMVASGFVERAPDALDRRRFVVSLTARGRGAATVATSAMAAGRALVVAVEPDERRALRAGLKALIQIGVSHRN